MKMAVVLLVFMALPAIAAERPPRLRIIPIETTPDCPTPTSVNPAGIYVGHVVGHLAGALVNPTETYDFGNWSFNVKTVHCEECDPGQYVVFGNYSGFVYTFSGGGSIQELGTIEGIFNSDENVVGFYMHPFNCPLISPGEPAGFYLGGSIGEAPGNSIAITSDSTSPHFLGRISGKTCNGWDLTTDVSLPR